MICYFYMPLFTKKIHIHVAIDQYSHFVPIPTLRMDNSGIEPHKVRILTLSAKVGIPTSRRTIPKLSRFSLCAEHIYIYIYLRNKETQQTLRVIESIQYDASF